MRMVRKLDSDDTNIKRTVTFNSKTHMCVYLDISYIISTNDNKRML